MTDETKRTRAGTTRRRILQIGGAAVVLGGGALTWRGLDRGAFSSASGPAYAPWELLDDPDIQGTPLAIVAAGVLAANAHNTQPWLFEVGETEIAVYADLSRHLGSFDPILREMHLSLGCALENMIVAAPAQGYAADLLPEGGTLVNTTARDGRRLTARLRLNPVRRQVPSPLAQVLTRRHTDRGPFDVERPVPPALQEMLSGLAERPESVRVRWVEGGTARARFDALTVSATERIIRDHQMAADSDRWFRLTQREIDEHRDGPTIDAAGLPASIRVIAKLLPRMSAEDAHAVWLQTTRDVHLKTAPLVGMITVTDLYDIPQALEAGRLWQRLHLEGTAQGLSLHPINQTVEVVDRERELNAPARMAEDLAQLIGTRTERPTFVFRAGYGMRDTLPSPRRALEDVVLP